MPIIYDSHHDPLNRRRLSRARFAFYSLPALIACWLVFALQDELIFLLNDGKGLKYPKPAMAIITAVSYTIMHYLQQKLMLRCNDAEPNWLMEKVLFVLIWIAALSNGLPMLQSAPLAAAVVVQFTYGMLLPANSVPNLSGGVEPDNPSVRLGALIACLLALSLLWVVFRLAV